MWMWPVAVSTLENHCVLNLQKKSLKLPHFKKMFPVQKNLHNMEKRNKNKFVVNSTKTDR